jgi:hypothetical protein
MESAMTATMLKMPRAESGRLECQKCGATAEASCGCGVDYKPAAVRAADAIAKNPGLSDRAIAADIGVNQSTVSLARKSTDARASVAASAPAPAKRVGRDGKARSMPTKPARQVKDEALAAMKIHRRRRNLRRNPSP